MLNKSKDLEKIFLYQAKNIDKQTMDNTLRFKLKGFSLEKIGRNNLST